MTTTVAAPSGLELFEGLLRGELEPPPMAKLMGLELVEASAGRIVFESEPQERFYNPIGSVHGGYAATLLDSALGCAVHSTLEPGAGYTTLGLEVKYVRPITLDTGRVRVVGEVEHRGRRQATASARLTTVAEGKLLAHGTTTCLIA
ncbi:MAG TPA: PaaI family thioesterase [Solirubrobacterales bacterium]